MNDLDKLKFINDCEKIKLQCNDFDFESVCKNHHLISSINKECSEYRTIARYYLLSGDSNLSDLLNSDDENKKKDAERFLMPFGYDDYKKYESTISDLLSVYDTLSGTSRYVNMTASQLYEIQKYYTENKIDIGKLSTMKIELTAGWDIYKKNISKALKYMYIFQSIIEAKKIGDCYRIMPYVMKHDESDLKVLDKLTILGTYIDTPDAADCIKYLIDNSKTIDYLIRCIIEEIDKCERKCLLSNDMEASCTFRENIYEILCIIITLENPDYKMKLLLNKLRNPADIKTLIRLDYSKLCESYVIKLLFNCKESACILNYIDADNFKFYDYLFSNKKFKILKRLGKELSHSIEENHMIACITDKGLYKYLSLSDFSEEGFKKLMKLVPEIEAYPYYLEMENGEKISVDELEAIIKLKIKCRTFQRIKRNYKDNKIKILRFLTNIQKYNIQSIKLIAMTSTYTKFGHEDDFYNLFAYKDIESYKKQFFPNIKIKNNSTIICALLKMKKLRKYLPYIKSEEEILFLLKNLDYNTSLFDTPMDILKYLCADYEYLNNLDIDFTDRAVTSRLYKANSCEIYKEISDACKNNKSLAESYIKNYIYYGSFSHDKSLEYEIQENLPEEIKHVWDKTICYTDKQYKFKETKGFINKEYDYDDSQNAAYFLNKCTKLIDIIDKQSGTHELMPIVLTKYVDENEGNTVFEPKLCILISPPHRHISIDCLLNILKKIFRNYNISVLLCNNYIREDSETIELSVYKPYSDTDMYGVFRDKNEPGNYCNLKVIKIYDAE